MQTTGALLYVLPAQAAEERETKRAARAALQASSVTTRARRRFGEAVVARAPLGTPAWLGTRRMWCAPRSVPNTNSEERFTTTQRWCLSGGCDITGMVSRAAHEQEERSAYLYLR